MEETFTHCNHEVAYWLRGTTFFCPVTDYSNMDYAKNEIGLIGQELESNRWMVLSRIICDED